MPSTRLLQWHDKQVTRLLQPFGIAPPLTFDRLLTLLRSLLLILCRRHFHEEQLFGSSKEDDIDVLLFARAHCVANNHGGMRTVMNH